MVIPLQRRGLFNVITGCVNQSMLGLARKELSQSELNTWDYVKMGIHIGMVVILVVWLCWDAMDNPSHGVNFFARPVISIYSACAGLLLLIWFWGLNLVVWQRTNIDYASMFGFGIENMASPMAIFTEVSMCTIIFLINIILYYKILLDMAGKYGGNTSRL